MCVRARVSVCVSAPPPGWPCKKVSVSKPADPGFDSSLSRVDFSSITSDSKIGTPVATLPGDWRYGVSAGTGWPGVSIMGLGEVESFFFLQLLSQCVST